MSDTKPIYFIPFAPDPETISVSGPDRGRYNLLSNEESDRYTVRVAGVVCSTTMSIDLSDQIADLDWSEKIPAIANEAKKWISRDDFAAQRAAVLEWIELDDPEDERLIAIESAQTEFDAKQEFARIRRLSSSTQERVLELMREVTA